MTSPVRFRRVLPRAVLAAGAVVVAIAASTPTAQAAVVAQAPQSTVFFNGTVYHVVYAGNTIYVGGEFTTARRHGVTVTRNRAAAINAVTGDLLPWNPDVNLAVRAIAVDGGSVYLGGDFSTVGDVARRRIARVHAATGAVDPAFVHRMSSRVRVLAAGHGRLYAGGHFTAVDGVPRSFAAAFSLATGALDAGWQPVLNDSVRAIDASTGRVFLGGYFSSLNGVGARARLAAVHPATAAIDGSFAASVPYAVRSLDITGLGVYAAMAGPGGRVRAWTLAGAARWEVTTDGDAQAVTVLGDTVYGGGHFANVCRSPRTGNQGTCLDGFDLRRKIFAVDLDGHLLPWAPQANSAEGVFSLDANAARGTVAAGGAFTMFADSTIWQPYFAQFSPS